MTNKAHSRADRLATKQKKVNDTWQFLANMGMPVPHPLDLQRLRFEFLISYLAEKFGEDFYFEFEDAWLDSMAEVADQALGKTTPEQRREGLIDVKGEEIPGQMTVHDYDDDGEPVEKDDDDE